MTLESEQRQEALDQAEIAKQAYTAHEGSNSPFAKIYQGFAQGLADLLSRTKHLSVDETAELRGSVGLGTEDKNNG
jgi:hypothetical protein